MNAITSKSRPELPSPLAGELNGRHNPDNHTLHSIPSLTGLRGVAVMLVIIDHIWLSTHRASPFIDHCKWAEGMWIGVDLFFVLSGFLLTRILLQTQSSSRYFRNFYARRCLRIFPLYFTVLSVLLLVSFLTSSPPAFRMDLSGLLCAATFTVNILFFTQGSWALPIAGLELGNLWSLSVEEHFYLVWPWIVRKLSGKAIGIATTVAIIASIIGRSIYFANSHDFMGIAALTPFRLDGFFAGAGVAAAIASADKQTLRPIFRLSFLFLLVATLALVAKTHLFRGDFLMSSVGYSLLALTFAVLVGKIVISEPHGLLNRIFSRRELMFFGKYSYAIYLFHFPLAMFINEQLVRLKVVSDTVLVVVGILAPLAASILLAMLTWRLIEKPALDLKSRFQPAQTLTGNQ